MVKLQDSTGKEWRLKFIYHPLYRLAERMTPVHIPGAYRTAAVLYNLDTKEEMYACVQKAKDDKPNGLLARKYAFQKLLDNNFEREDRKKLWEGYLKQVRIR